MKKSGVFAWYAALFTACGAMSGSREACAQTADVPAGGQLEEVIVTAEGRVSTAQKTAAAISVRSETSISYNHTLLLGPGMDLRLGGSVRFASAHM